MKHALGLAFVLLASSVAHADVQRWPFSFDPSLSADESTVASDLASGAASLPALPTTELQTLDTDGGSMTLWLWPDNARLLAAVAAAGTTPMIWPTTPTLCAKTDAFSIPTLLGASPTSTCSSADASIRQQLADLSACDLVDRPELYVTSYDPSNAANDMDSLEDMIGVAGNGFFQDGAPPDGILPPDFVPTLRVIIDKLRYTTLTAKLASAKAAYAQALSTANANASCFDPAALSTLTSGLADLSSELGAASSYLGSLESAGLAQSQQQALCLAAGSRTRNTLAFPALTDDERRFVAFWLGAVYWRMRGGGLIPLGSTQDARWDFLYQAYSRIGEMLSGSDGDSVAFDFYTEVVVDGWGDWQDMGTTAGGGDKYEDLIGMTERGQRQAQTAIHTLQPLGYDTADLMTGGLQMGPGYYYAWAAAPSFRYGMPPPAPYSAYIDSPTAVGEFNMGAALESGLARVLLAGKPTGQAPTVMLCEGRSCGSDGCGGSCGSCASGTCDNGQCVDEPDGGAPDLAAPFTPATPDAGVRNQGAASSGCGCAIGGAPASAPWALVLAGAAWLVLRRRRVPAS